MAENDNPEIKTNGSSDSKETSRSTIAKIYVIAYFIVRYFDEKNEK